MFNPYYSYWQNLQRINRQIILDEFVSPPGPFGLVQTVGKPCVDDSFTFVRVFNAITEPISITVYIDDIGITRRLKYKGFSYYLPIPKGNHVIRVYSDAQPNTPIIQMTNLDIPTSQVVTIPIWKQGESLQLMVLVDDVTLTVEPDKNISRLVNLTQDDLSFNVTASDEKYNVTRELDSGGYEGYVARDPLRYTFEFRVVSQMDIRPVITTFNELASRMYTKYIIGSMDPQSEVYAKGYHLEIVVSTDGNTIIRRCPPM